MKKSCLLVMLFLWTMSSYRLSAQSILTEFQYTGEKYIQLDGAWRFYWNSRYSEDLLKLDSSHFMIIHNPDLWTNYQWQGEVLPSFGYGTYICFIESEADFEDVAFGMAGFYSAYNLYLNGRLLGSNGLVGGSPEHSSLEWLPQNLKASLTEGRNVVALEVSNYQHHKAGFFVGVVLGQEDYLTQQENRRIRTDMFGAGAFLMIGVFFLVMYFVWRRSGNYLLYFILTLCYCLRILTVGSHQFTVIFPGLSWQWAVGIEYAALYVNWISTLILVSERLHKWVYRVWLGLFALLTLSVVGLPLHHYAKLLPYALVLGYCCYGYVFYCYLISKQPKDRAYYAIMIFLVLTFLSWFVEFLIFFHWVSGVDYFPNVIRILSVLSLGFLISEKYNIAYEEVSGLRKEALAQKATIEQQYHELSQQSSLLEDRNHKIETLFKEVHHRVKNNLQLISSLLDVHPANSSTGDPGKILEDSRGRVATMSLIHQSLYMNEDISEISLHDYVTELINQLTEVYGLVEEIEAEIQTKDTCFDVDTITPLGLILTELITNVFKYTQPSRPDFKLIIVVELSGKGEYQLQVTDSGPELPMPFQQLIHSGYGLRLAHRLAMQLHGKLSHQYNEGNIFTVSFKDTWARKQRL